MRGKLGIRSSYPAIRQARDGRTVFQPYRTSTLHGKASLLMSYCLTIPILMPNFLELTRAAQSTPPGISRSTHASVKASRWNARFCGVTVEAAPSTVMAALSAGRLFTVWNAPEEMTAGETGMVALPELSELTSAVTTNCRSCPVDTRDCGFTAYTLAIVNTSPALRRLAALAVQPSVTSVVAPLVVEPFMSGVPPRGPTVWL